MRWIKIVVAACVLSGMLAATAMAETIRFPGPEDGGKNVELSGEMMRPKGAGPFPAIVMLHPCRGILPDIKDWARTFADWGYLAFIVDSMGPRGVENLCDEPFLVGPETRADDAHSAKAYLAELPIVDPEKIVVVGWSHGGMSTIASLTDHPLKDRGVPFRAAVAFYPYCYQSMDKLNAPLLILTGEKDDWCLADQCVNFVPKDKTRYEVKIHVYPDSYHGFDLKSMDETYLGHRVLYNPEAAADAVVRVREFLEKYIK